LGSAIQSLFVLLFPLIDGDVAGESVKIPRTRLSWHGLGNRKRVHVKAIDAELRFAESLAVPNVMELQLAWPDSKDTAGPGVVMFVRSNREPVAFDVQHHQRDSRGVLLAVLLRKDGLPDSAQLLEFVAIHFLHLFLAFGMPSFRRRR